MPGYQRELHARLRGAGFAVAVLRGVDDVEAALAEWGLPIR
ncbi:hypothetical protein [Methylobacterium sp. E-016]|nr:hypothetical protein [Methylobacterium sp. E-016]